MAKILHSLIRLSSCLIRPGENQRGLATMEMAIMRPVLSTI